MLRIASFAALLALSSAAAPAGAESTEKRPEAVSYVDVARRVLPAVVNISIEPRITDATEEGEGTDEQDLMQFLMEHQMGQMATVSGSGVLIRREGGKGYVLTNNHVVDSFNIDENVMTLTFHEREENSTEYNKTTRIAGESVRVVGKDRFSDLAVIEFDAPAEMGIEPVAFADSDRTEIGENVLALGNPMDLNHTVTRGIISGKSRFLGSQISLEKLLQTDAAIQPGNSGGPLVNLAGEIVGINTAIATRTGFWQGIGFAIPSNDAKRIADQLQEMGRVPRGYLGVQMGNMPRNSPAARQLKMGEEAGVLIQSVVPNSSADVGGVHAGDVVVQVDGEPVRAPDDMLRLIATRAADTTVTLSLVRADEESGEPLRLAVDCVLAERPPDPVLNQMHGGDGPRSMPAVPEVPRADGQENFGLELAQHLDRATAKGGLLVKAIAPDSAGAEAGLAAGDIITTLNGRSVRSLDDFRAAMLSPGRRGHLVKLLREGRERTLLVRE